MPAHGPGPDGGTVGVLASTVLAGPVLAAGGYPAVGAASVLACLLAAAVATRFPEHREPPCPERMSPAAGPGEGDEGDGPGLVGQPARRAGRGPRRPYGPGGGAAARRGDGGLGRAGRVHPAAGRRHRRRPRDRAVVASAALARGDGRWPARPAGRAADHPGVRRAARVFRRGPGRRGAVARPAGFVLVAAGFCGFQLATVLADARLQARITGTGRATVTSLAGTATDLGTIAVYGGYALLAPARATVSPSRCWRCRT